MSQPPFDPLGPLRPNWVPSNVRPHPATEGHVVVEVLIRNPEDAELAAVYFDDLAKRFRRVINPRNPLGPFGIDG